MLLSRSGTVAFCTEGRRCWATSHWSTSFELFLGGGTDDAECSRGSPLRPGAGEPSGGCWAASRVRPVSSARCALSSGGRRASPRASVVVSKRFSETNSRTWLLARVLIHLEEGSRNESYRLLEMCVNREQISNRRHACVRTREQVEGHDSL